MYLYIFLRTDLSISQQIVQASHATFASGYQCKTEQKLQEDPSIVLIEISNRDDLERELLHIQSLGIQCAPFYETYNDMGLTSFSTLPIGQELRHHFSHYQLWGRVKKEKKKFPRPESFEINHTAIGNSHTLINI